METMLALKEFLEPGWFLAATVDAVIPQTELARFVNEARRKTELYNDKNFAGVLAVTQWREEAGGPFPDATKDNLIAGAGGPHTQRVTGGADVVFHRAF